MKKLFIGGILFAACACLVFGGLEGNGGLSGTEASSSGGSGAATNAANTWVSNQTFTVVVTNTAALIQSGAATLSGINTFSGPSTFNAATTNTVTVCVTTNMVIMPGAAFANITTPYLLVGTNYSGAGAGIMFGAPASYTRDFIRCENQGTNVFTATAGGQINGFGRNVNTALDNTKLVLDVAGGNALIGNVSSTASSTLSIESGRSAGGSISLKNSNLANVVLATNGNSFVFKTTHTGGLAIGVGTLLTNAVAASANLDFPSVAAQTDTNLTIAVSGCLTNDLVILGPPWNQNTGLISSAFVVSNGFVAVRISNISSGAIDQASMPYNVLVIQK